MFGFVENHKKWVQIGLIVVSLPFVATGMMGYVNGSMSPGARLVQIEGGRSIPEGLFEQRWTTYLQSKPKSKLSVEAQKQAILDSIIDDQVFKLYADRQEFTVSDEVLRERIAQEPLFQDGQGHFSLSRYHDVLSQAGHTESEFQSSVRNALILQPIESLVRPWLAEPLIDYLVSLYETQRVTRKAVISWEQYAPTITVDDATAKAYYSAHMKQYAEPDKVKLESIEVSAETVKSLVAVTPEMIASYYEQHKSDYVSTETRKVRHILLKVDPKATPAEKTEKKAKIEQWLKELKAAPEKFAAYAKQYSEDPGSASQGGELGDVTRGVMVKAFEDAVFNASAHTLIGPIETQFGYHLIEVEEIHPAQQKPLEAVKSDIEDAVRQQETRKKLESLVVKLDQPQDDLSILAKNLGLQLKHSDWLDEHAIAEMFDGRAGLASQLIDNGQKNDLKPLPLQELKGNRFVMVRAQAFQAAHQPAFEVVKTHVVHDVQREKGIIKARTEGAALLKALQAKQKVSVTWAQPEVIVYHQPNSLSPALEKAVRQLHSKPGVPAYAGSDDPQGYAIVVLDAVITPTLDAKKREQIRPVLEQLWAEQGRRAFAEALRKVYDVKVNETRWQTILTRHDDAPSSTTPEE